METRYLLGQTINLYETSGDYDLIQVCIPAHTSGPPPHLHKNFDEFFLLIEGELEVLLAGTVSILKAGEFIDIPVNTIHTFNNISDSQCTLFSIHHPKGFAKFFKKFGIPDGEPNALERSLDPLIIEEIIKTADDFDMDMKL